MHPFFTSWKHQKTVSFSGVLTVRFSVFFQGVKKGVLGTNGLTVSCEPINYFVLLESKHKKVSTLIKP